MSFYFLFILGRRNLRQKILCTKTQKKDENMLICSMKKSRRVLELLCHGIPEGNDRYDMSFFFLSMFIINGWKCSPGIYSCGFSRRRRKKEKKQMFCFVLCAKTKRSPRKTQCNYEIAAIYI
jgi:hypothetical protein